MLLVYLGVDLDGTDVTAAGDNPLFFGLTGGGIESLLARERRGGIPVVGSVDEQDGTRSDLTNDAGRTCRGYIATGERIR